MPSYYCDTCQKTLARHEQRHNKERITTPGPIVVGQLNNLPGDPLIGLPLTNQREITVIRCVTCGSDARVIYTAEEKRREEEESQQGCLLVFGLFVGIPICLVGSIALLASNPDALVPLMGFVVFIVFLFFLNPGIKWYKEQRRRKQQQANYGAHKFNSHGFCERCGWERGFLVKTERLECSQPTSPTVPLPVSGNSDKRSDANIYTYKCPKCKTKSFYQPSKDKKKKPYHICPLCAYLFSDAERSL